MNKDMILRIILSSVISGIINSYLLYFIFGSKGYNIPNAGDIAIVFLPIFIVSGLVSTLGIFTFLGISSKK